MDEAELIDRSMRFAVQVTRFLGTLRDTQEGRHISWQWFECSTFDGGDLPERLPRLFAPRLRVEAWNRRGGSRRVGVPAGVHRPGRLLVEPEGPSGPHAGNVRTAGDLRRLSQDGESESRAVAAQIQAALRRSLNHPSPETNRNLQIANRNLPERFHDLVQRFLARPHALERQGGQRLVDDVQLGQEVVAIRLDVDQAGRELAAA